MHISFSMPVLCIAFHSIHFPREIMLYITPLLASLITHTLYADASTHLWIPRMTLDPLSTWGAHSLRDIAPAHTTPPRTCSAKPDGSDCWQSKPQTRCSRNTITLPLYVTPLLASRFGMLIRRILILQRWVITVQENLTGWVTDDDYTLNQSTISHTNKLK